MRQLELKDIVNYLPYKLKALGSFIGNSGICEITRTYKGGVYVGVGDDEVTIPYESFKPILRPLSHLYTTIIHNGKEIIPIVECAKICYPSIHNEAICGGQSFSYYKTDKCFTSYQPVFDTTSGDVIKNEYLLFDYLNSLKIDYRGLIDEGLAISVYDLKENPYK